MKEHELPSPDASGPAVLPTFSGASADDRGCAFVVAALLHHAGLDATVDARMRLAVERDAMVARVAERVLEGRRGLDFLVPVLFPSRFRDAWRDEAQRALEGARRSDLLSAFEEPVLRGLSGDVFARLLQETERARSQALIRAGEEDGVPMGLAVVDAVRRRIARKWILERAARALPAAFLLLAAAVAVGMVLRVLKLPG